MATFWVVSAKRPETRTRRLATLVECSAEERRVPALTM
jgi:Bacteriocin-protection, YdeI or OmpD-Associated